MIKMLKKVFVITLSVFIGLLAFHWNQSRIEQNEALESLKKLRLEIIFARQNLEQTVASNIKVKEASVKMLEKKVTMSDLDELDRLNLLVKRNFKLNLPMNIIQDLLKDCSKYKFSNDSLKRQLMMWPVLMKSYLDDEKRVDEFYQKQFLPWLISNSKLADELNPEEKQSLYNSVLYRNLVKEKMELTIHTLFDGQVMKNYTDDLIADLEVEIVVSND